MLNFIWPAFLIISLIYGICFGNIDKTNAAIFESTENAINLCIQLLGTICLWNGIMKIAEKTSIIGKLKKTLKPIIKNLFPQIREDEEVNTTISMNMIANIMGLRKRRYTDGTKNDEITSKKK